MRMREDLFDILFQFVLLAGVVGLASAEPRRKKLSSAANNFTRRLEFAFNLCACHRRR